MTKRKSIPSSDRSHMLLMNQHACCICGKSGVQIHHINGDHSDNDPSNLAVLCIRHHDDATKPRGMSARLNADQIKEYKATWEKACHERTSKGARACTAFFMVDYRNAERIRQLFSQLTSIEYVQAFEIICDQLKEETRLRKDQGFDKSLEPNLIWSPHLEKLLPFVRQGNPHPSIFEGAQGHPSDPLFPNASVFSDVRVPLYEIWCQLMVRALIAVRTPYLLVDLLNLDDFENSSLAGCLVAFNGMLAGNVYSPGDWSKKPISQTELTVSNEKAILSANLRLKTHYVYSLTGADSLSEGRSNGLLMLRDFYEFRFCCEDQ